MHQIMQQKQFSYKEMIMEFNISVSSIQNYSYQWKNNIIPWNKNFLLLSKLFKNKDTILIEYQKKPSSGPITTISFTEQTLLNYYNE